MLPALVWFFLISCGSVLCYRWVVCMRVAAHSRVRVYRWHSSVCGVPQGSPAAAVPKHHPEGSSVSPAGEASETACRGGDASSIYAGLAFLLCCAKLRKIHSLIKNVEIFTEIVFCVWTTICKMFEERHRWNV